MTLFAVDVQRTIDPAPERDDRKYDDTVTLNLAHGTTLKAAVDFQHVLFEAARLAHSSALPTWGNEHATLVYVRLRMTDRWGECGTVISRLTPAGTGDW